MLAKNKNTDTADHTEELQNNAKVLVETLRSFRVGVKEVTYSRGPTITRYELKPEVGTRVRSIANLVDDIALNLATSRVRIEAPIPGKAAVGIEVPNQTRATVYLRDLIDNPKFTESKSKLTAALGADVGGNPIHFDIGKMPHLLIAGTTGSGKSICINCVIVSILYKAKPDEVKLILIDPKKVEFNMYKNIPHLYCPIVSDPKKAAGALASAVTEMERRFELIEQVGVRDIAGYNAVAETDPDLEFMPHMVIIIDELADLMMTARDEVETNICRIAQKARAAGIHMILGTQRPSVDVITGLIKANVPSRIACTVMSQVDSRTIIDVAGAESLIGRGDMLFAPVGASKPLRVQGAFVHENEIERIVSFIKENNGEAHYNTEFVNRIEVEAAKCGMGKKGAAAQDADMPSVEGGDTKFSEAVKLAIETGKISTSLMQRRLGVGYGRAAKIIDTMEEMGYVSAPDGNKPRQVLITMDEYMRRMVDGNLGGADV
jgi:S-DNA-T family DNA segregation ATPase FtsK/SpoIIIE